MNQLFISLFEDQDANAASPLNFWRMRVLDIILRGVFILWVVMTFSGIGTVLIEYKSNKDLYQNPLALAATIIIFFVLVILLLAFVMVYRNLHYKFRAGVLLFSLYILGTIGMSLSSFSGDGRVLFFTFLILIAIFFDFRTAFAGFILIALTMITLGYLQTSGALMVPEALQVNAAKVHAWVRGGLVLLVLGIAVMLSITSLLRALEQSLRETNARAHELTRLYEAAKDMAERIGDPSSLLKSLAQHMAEALQATSANIMSIDVTQGSMTTLAEYWAESSAASERVSDIGRVYPAKDYLTVIRAVAAGAPVTMHYDAPNLTEEERRQFVEYGIKSMLFVPIMARGQLLGDAEIWESRYRREFTAAEIHLVHAMASHAAAIIESAQLLAETRQRENELSTLLSVSKAVSSSIDLKDVLKDAATSLARVMRADYCTLSEYDQTSDAIRTIALYAPDGEMDESSDKEFLYPLAEYPVVMQVFETNIPVVVHVDDPHADAMEVCLLLEAKKASNLILPLRVGAHPLGLAELYSSDPKREFRPEEIELARALADQIAIAIENARLYKRLENREAYFRAMFENLAEGVAVLTAEGRFTYITPSEEKILGYAYEDVIGHYFFEIVCPDDLEKAKAAFQTSIETQGDLVVVEYRAIHADGSWRDIEVLLKNMLSQPGINGIVANFRDVSERKQAERALKESQSRLEGIINTALNAIITVDKNQRVILFNPFAEITFGCSAEDAFGKPLDTFIPERFRHRHSTYVTGFGHTNVSGRNHGRLDTLYGLRSNGEEFPMEAFISQHTIGDEKFYTVILRDITERKQAEDAIRRRAEELQTLVLVSSALRSALNVSEIIPLIVRHAVEIVGGDFGTVYLLEELTGTLASPGWYSVEVGEDIKVTGEAVLRHVSGKGITGHVVKTGQMYITTDLHNDSLSSILPQEEEVLRYARSGISLPLLSQEKVIGVLHVRLREQHVFNETEIRLLTAIAEMAGNALHRAMLYEQTQKQADELARAYDNTLSGWARALELRDELTEGHTRRVTELTLKLARAMNIPEYELVQIRRGAILHDIGKMGIPDAILHKPGPLTAHEQRIMQMHTQYAYEMLSFIPFLRTALDIPYCHHERWDGAGYPRRLKAEEIPLAARIFAIVDVWDALTSDRPYRSAWSKEKALEYIRSNSGAHFDPNIVQKFIAVLSE